MHSATKLRFDEPVFVFGSPRSGTTWLYTLLCSAGGFAVYRSESHAFHALGPRFGGLRTPALREEFLREWLPSEYFLRSGLEPEPFCTRFRETVRCPADFLRLLMESIAEYQGAVRWAECTPECSMYTREILAAWPKARFLHIIRDGRDVALSLAHQHAVKSLPWQKDFPQMAAAVYWEWMNLRGLEGCERAPSQYMQVRFADLVRDTPGTLEKIGSFISQKLDWDRIQRNGFGPVRQPNTSFKTELQTGDFNPVDRWRTGFTASELQRIESVIGNGLRTFGFELATPPDKRTPSAADSVSRQIYRARLNTRTYLKSRITFTRRWVGADFLNPGCAPKTDVDPTLRPNLNKDYVRSIVNVA